MRILGIDYGRVRLGLALSDEEGILASPLPPLARSHGDAERGSGQFLRCDSPDSSKPLGNAAP